jgi:hypothetical protein
MPKMKRAGKMKRAQKKSEKAFLHLENRLIRLFRGGGIGRQAAENLAKEANKKLQKYRKHRHSRAFPVDI